MKIKLLAVALSLSLMACVEQKAKDITPMQEASAAENISITSSEPDLDFKYTYMETRGKQRFSREISKEEEETFYNRQLNGMDGARNKDRFNRKVNEPVLEPDELKKREQIIEQLLKNCARLIGKEPNDRNFRLHLKEDDIFFIAIIKTPDPEYIRRAQPIYLSGYMQKCTQYLYPANPRTSPSAYNFSNFEYQNYDSNNTQDQLKRQKIEKLYEEIYLEVKSAGLLRKFFYTYYPKSFLREHADQTSLTKFIQEKEAKAGKPLKHDELATEFFGSREKWIESFDQFLDQKMINQKIETQVASQVGKAA